MTPEPASYPRHRFPAEIISHAVWLYHVFSLSLRDVELILAERGIVVTHESIRQASENLHHPGHLSRFGPSSKPAVLQHAA